MKILTKIKEFFIKILPSRRKIIQLYAALLYNAHIKGFISGEIFEGATKNLCVPGLNCYSCPGAIGACPLGSLQNALAESKTKLPTYILGIILLYMIIFGRTICGFLCPVGLFQELLYKIKTPKLQKNKFTKILSYLKYVILVVFVIIIPLIYGLQQLNVPLPAFCKYICPAGTFEGAIFLLANPNNTDFYGMLGSLFTWKFMLLIMFIVASVFIFRFFCRFFCPLGAIYGLFNKIAVLGVKVNDSKCNKCGACVTHCKMDVTTVGDSECIQCGECIEVCKPKAISWKLIKEKVHAELAEEKMALLNGNLNENENNTETVSELDNKTKKPSNVKLISTILAIVLLITAFFYVNFRKTEYKVSSICDKITITLEDNNKFSTSTDGNSTLMYFYNNLSNEELDSIKNYASEVSSYNQGKLNIILISSYDAVELITNEQKEELKKLNIQFAKDTKNSKLLKSFVKDVKYPYTIFLDEDDKLLIKENSAIDDDLFTSTIIPTVLGYKIGNEVGNICINKEIPLIGSDETFSVADNYGKIIVINFWFTGCTPCVKELPHFNKLYEEYKEDVVVIAIHEAGDYQKDPEKVKNFIQNQFNGFTILFGYDDVESPYYTAVGGKQAWPTTVIVDKEGIVSLVNQGDLSEDELRAEIEKLLK